MTLRLNGDSSGFTEIKAADAAGDNSIKLPAANGSANQLLQNGGTAGELQYTSNVFVDSSGRLLVGRSSTSSVLTSGIELSAAGTGIDQPSYQVFSYPGIASGSNTGYLQFYRSGSGTVGTNTLLSNQARLGMVRFSGADGTDYRAGAEIYADTAGTPGADVMPTRLVFATNSGSVSPTERIEIGSNGALKLLSGCPGIDFSGIQTASPLTTSETLDYYEEGTWTPIPRGASVSGTYTPQYENARYVRIGRMVHIEVYAAWTGHTGSGGLQIHGLPFTVNNQSIYGGPAINYWTQITLPSGASPHALFVNNGNHIYFYQQLAGAAAIISMTSSGSIIMAGAYSVA